MKQFWDERYATEEYVYGKEPNVFFKSWIDRQAPGSILLPGDGEGRNGVYAAGLGWDVVSIDQSETARDKAARLAAEKGVSLDYRCGPLQGLLSADDRFDMIAMIFFHLPPEVRGDIHSLLTRHLEKGGLLLVEAFSKEQLGRSSGGPQNIDMLYSLEDLIGDFPELEVQHASTEEVTLSEGRFHKGEAIVIRFVGKK